MAPVEPRPADQAELLRRLTDLVAGANAGADGLTGLQVAVELAAMAAGGDGACFIEYGERGGRVVAACGGVAFLVGRPVAVGSPAPAQVQEMSIRDLADEVPPVAGGEFPHLLRACARAGDMPVGALEVYFRDEARRVVEPGRSWVRLLAGYAAHLYADGSGLPVYEAGPRLGPVSLALAVVGPDGVVRSWTPGAERLTALPAVEVVGQPFPFRLPGPSPTVEQRLPCGTWIAIRATPVAGTDGVVLSMREHSDPGEQERARDLFLAVASHELRTPVTVIRGYADTLVEHWDVLDEPSRREAAFVMGQRARELARLVDRMLTAASDAAAPSDGAAGVPVDLADAVREATADLTPEVRAAVRLHMPAVLPKAVGDRAGLATVATELLTNACKYSPARVHVEVTAGADPQTVWFRVADRGVGIRPEHVERAFERFWQLDRGDRRRYSGVGLGLYLVRRIVERQNGWVSLRPREGGGTVAEVRLPRADVSTGEV